MVGSGVRVGVAVMVGDGVLVGVAVAEAVGEGVSVGVEVIVGVGDLSPACGSDASGIPAVCRTIMSPTMIKRTAMSTPRAWPRWVSLLVFWFC